MKSLSNMPLGSLTPSIEQIAFQNDMFFKELTMAYAALRRLDVKAMPESEEAQRFIGIVKYHTKMNIMFNFGEYDPCVEIPRVDRNNILVNDMMRQYLDSASAFDLLNKAHTLGVRGSVNLKTGEVSGCWEDFPTVIHIPLTMLKGSEFSDAEMAAITLHEVGHISTYFEYMGRSIRTNQVLAALAKGLDGTSDINLREHLLVTAKQALKIKDLDAKALAKLANSEMVEVVLITNVIQETKSEIGSNIYDDSTWEMLADQYAARQGAGAELVTALNKLYKGMWMISYRGMGTYLFMEAVKVLLLASGTGMVLSLLLMMSDSDGPSDYDRPAARMLRIRNQLVERLKDKKLPPAMIRELTDDLETIDQVTKKINDRRQLLSVLLDVVVPFYRKARSQYELQRDLENIAMNELFVQSAKLRGLAKEAKAA